MQTGDVTLAAQLPQALGNFLGGLLLPMLPWLLLYCAIGLAIALVLMGYIARKGLLSRRPRPWNLLAKLAYPLILASVIACCAAVGVVYQTQQRVQLALQEALLPALQARAPALSAYLATQLRRHGPGGGVTVETLVRHAVQDFYYQPASDSWVEHCKARVVNRMVLQFGVKALTVAFQQLAVGKLEAVAGALKRDIHGQPQGELVQLGADLLVRVGTDASRNVDFSQLEMTLPQVIVNAVRGQVNGYFGGLYAGIALLFGAVALLLAAEMLIYFQWYRKRGGAAVPPPDASRV